MKAVCCLALAGGWLLGGLAGVAGPAPEVSSPTLTPPELAQTLVVMLPRQLEPLPFAQPRARLKLDLDSAGQVLDLVCLEASHFDLIEPALRETRTARFRPSLEEGQAVPCRFELIVNFTRRSDLGMTNQDVADNVLSAIGRMQNEMTFLFQESPVRELDQPPQLREPIVPTVVTDDQGRPVAGSALVECYLDHTGTVRLPRILRSTHPEVAEAALLNLRTARFAPPTRQGRPTAVRVRIPFEVQAPLAGPREVP